MLKNKTKSQREEFQLLFLFILFVSITVFGLLIYRNCILDNSILEYEELGHYETVGRSKSFMMKMRYNGTTTDISISKESSEGVEQGIKPLVFYNAGFDDPFTFLHLILLMKFLGGIFILAGFGRAIFLIIDWQVKSTIRKGVIIILVLCSALIGYYFISYENKSIEALTFGYSSENETILFSSFEKDSVVHWEKLFLPSSYQYEGVYRTFHYPDFFKGEHRFLADIIDYSDLHDEGNKKLLCGKISVLDGNKTVELDSNKIVEITLFDGSVRTIHKCSGGFFCIELPVSKSVDAWFMLEGYKTKKVNLLIPEKSDISYAVADYKFSPGAGVEEIDGVKFIEKTQKENIQLPRDSSRYVFKGEIMRNVDGAQVSHGQSVILEVYQNGSRTIDTLDGRNFSVELSKSQGATLIFTSEGYKTKKLHLTKVPFNTSDIFNANCVFEKGAGTTEKRMSLDSLATADASR
ncbi:MAG: hypothetical protein ACK4WD_11415 [Flavobacteriales bacterium]|jgi:hypothetical protein